MMYGSEITLDVVDSSDDFQARGGCDYSTHNIAQLNEQLFDVKKITINMPIINDNISDASKAKLIRQIKEIRKINPNMDISINMIRLMPVGKMAHNYPEKYNPEVLVKDLIRKITPLKVNTKNYLHCSLNASQKFTNSKRPCGMLERKIGIDCAGNVFACAWSAYLMDFKTKKPFESIEKNPFYLGNLLNDELPQILSGQHAIAMKSRIKDKKMFYCPLISYYYSGQWYNNNDPLSK